ncbi:MAG: hypothetical protein M0Z50_04380 [Planctomycetia bacterium]|nr:hypothetical protein [Planctomycetia bacterium]
MNDTGRPLRLTLWIAGFMGALLSAGLLATAAELYSMRHLMIHDKKRKMRNYVDYK